MARQPIGDDHHLPVSPPSGRPRATQHARSLGPPALPSDGAGPCSSPWPPSVRLPPRRGGRGRGGSAPRLAVLRSAAATEEPAALSVLSWRGPCPCLSPPA